MSDKTTDSRQKALDELARITQEELGGYEMTDNPLDRSQTTDDDLPTVAEVRGILKDYPAETEVEAFDCYGLAASLEPGVGLLLELAGDTTWLSWEETCKLAEYLRKVDEWKISHE